MLFREIKLENTDTLDASLYARFMELSSTDRIRQTHHFAGRFENTYVDAADMPEMACVLTLARQQAGRWLDMSADQLKAGFWFNAMGPGHRTAPHHHDENDELLSAVYYIRVPANSGDLVLYDEGKPIIIHPQQGKLVLFAPQVLHEVTTNNSRELRLSVAINVGPVNVGDG
jgi:hypothetical protein